MQVKKYYETLYTLGSKMNNFHRSAAVQHRV